MWPFNLFKKSLTLTDIDISSDSASVLLGLSENIPIQVPPRSAYYLSERNADLGIAIGRVSESVAGLKRILKDKNGNVISEHPLLSLLSNPGDGMSGFQFWRESTESYMLTQEGWIVARGNVTRPPLSLSFIRPYDVNAIDDYTTGIPSAITTISAKDRREYFRVPQGNGFRYFDKEKLNELIPIIGMVSIVDEWRGRSPLSKLFYDLKMNTDGKRHNVSMLKNGMRTTGILTPSGTKDGGQTLHWGADAVKKIEDRLRAFHQGAGNAGNVLILSTPAEIQGMTQSNKDMDYLSLLKVSQVSIYNLYSIPLPMVLSETMTLDNYTTANRVYYTKAVFPQFNALAHGIMSALAPRYKMDGMELTFKESDIKDLQTVLVENMKAMKDTEAMSVNDIRAVGGYDDIDDGDVVLISANKVPLSSVSVPLGFDTGMQDAGINDITQGAQDESGGTSADGVPQQNNS